MSNYFFKCLISMPYSKNNIVFLFFIVLLDKCAYLVLLCHCLK